MRATSSAGLAGQVPATPFSRSLAGFAAGETTTLAQQPQLGQVFPTIRAALLGAPGLTQSASGDFLNQPARIETGQPNPAVALEAFEQAWLVMYAAICRLDYLQDDDPVDTPLPVVGPPSAHYNLVFALYLLAESLLGEMADLVPAERLLRLRRFWAATMLRMADGQQRDLALTGATLADATLDDYQQLAQAKTGATFALAFGGAAMLLTDDARLIAALTLVGEIYGTLIQYADDLHDADSQPNQTMTLPALLRAHPPPGAQGAPAQVHAAFWSHLYPPYRDAALAALTDVAPAMGAPIASLFAQIFEHPAPRST